jgi:hypothetical protein
LELEEQQKIAAAKKAGAAPDEIKAIEDDYGNRHAILAANNDDERAQDERNAAAGRLSNSQADLSKKESDRAKLAADYAETQKRLQADADQTEAAVREVQLNGGDTDSPDYKAQLQKLIDLRRVMRKLQEESAKELRDADVAIQQAKAKVSDDRRDLATAQVNVDIATVKGDANIVKTQGDIDAQQHEDDRKKSEALSKTVKELLDGTVKAAARAGNPGVEAAAVPIRELADHMQNGASLQQLELLRNELAGFFKAFKDYDAAHVSGYFELAAQLRELRQFTQTMAKQITASRAASK